MVMELIDQYIILSIVFTLINLYCIKIRDIEIQTTLLLGLGFFNALGFLLTEIFAYPLPPLIFFIFNLTINLKMLFGGHKNE